jgi:hypothetical protein
MDKSTKTMEIPSYKRMQQDKVPATLRNLPLMRGVNGITLQPLSREI